MSEAELPEEFEAAIRAHIRNLAEPYATLVASQLYCGNEIREQTVAAYGRLNQAHMLLTGVLAAALVRINGKIVATDGASEERNALVASFVIGLRACEEVILEGRYLQACALLRQELEILAQLKAVRAGRRSETRAPNVASLERSMARLYGDLSAGAHASRHELVRLMTNWDLSDIDLPGPTAGTRQFPIFDAEMSRRLFGFHLLLIMRIIEDFSADLVKSHFEDRFTEQEVEALGIAMRLMQIEGIVEIDEVDATKSDEVFDQARISP